MTPRSVPTTQSKQGNLRYNAHLLALADQTKTQELAFGRAGFPTNQTSLSDCRQCTSLYTAPPFESALESSLMTARSKKIRFCKREVRG